MTESAESQIRTTPMSVRNSVRTEHLFCTVEWHLRETPRAALLHSYALRVAKEQTDGKKYFWLSIRQLADYFQWDKNTVSRAIGTLRDAGFFRLETQGRGINSSEYEVLTHSLVAATCPSQCRDRQLASKSDKTLASEQSLGVSENSCVASENLPLVSEPDRTDSPMYSPKDLPSESPTILPKGKEGRTDARNKSKSEKPKQLAAKGMIEWMTTLFHRKEIMVVPKARDLERLRVILVKEDAVTVILAFLQYLGRPQGFENMTHPFSNFFEEWSFRKWTVFHKGLGGEEALDDRLDELLYGSCYFGNDCEVRDVREGLKEMIQDCNSDLSTSEQASVM